jgi:metal-responsive CopG/Arc/MetJ family transcriptional regulator
MHTKRTHVILPEALVAQIDKLVGKRGRSRFLAQVAEREIARLRQLRALERAAGSWKDASHPELREGAAEWIETLRAEDEKRFRDLAKR